MNKLNIERLEELTGLKLHDVVNTKNGVKLHGVQVEGQDVSPCINYDPDSDFNNDFYYNLAHKIVDANNHNPFLSMELDKKISKSFILENLFARVEHGSHFKDLTANDVYCAQLEDINLVIYFTFNIFSDHSGFASIKLTNSLVKKFEISLEEISHYSFDNMHDVTYIKSLSLVLAELVGSDEDLFPTNDHPVYVVSNKEMCNGACQFLLPSVIDQLHEMLGDYVILPSSVHEVLAMPYSEDMNIQELRDMVSSVNSGVVDPVDKLSDDVFICDENGYRIA